MAAKRCHWKEKEGRFWARISIPATLRPCFGGKTELSEPLGGDRRIADRNHAAAVARLQEQIAAARRTLEPTPALPFPQDTVAPMTTADCKHAVWDHHTSTLERYEQRRASMPTLEAMSAGYDRLTKRIDAGEIDGGRDVIGMINACADYEAMISARDDERSLRARRLTVLRAALGHAGCPAGWGRRCTEASHDRAVHRDGARSGIR